METDVGPLCWFFILPSVTLDSWLSPGPPPSNYKVTAAIRTPRAVLGLDEVLCRGHSEHRPARSERSVNGGTAGGETGPVCLCRCLWYPQWLWGGSQPRLGWTRLCSWGPALCRVGCWQHPRLHTPGPGSTPSSHNRWCLRFCQMSPEDKMAPLRIWVESH